jgi:uncharacterized protein YjcR
MVQLICPQNFNPVYDLAEGLEVSAATIFRWTRQDQIDAGTAVGLSSQDGAELRAA